MNATRNGFLTTLMCGVVEHGTVAPEPHQGHYDAKGNRLTKFAVEDIASVHGLNVHDETELETNDFGQPHLVRTASLSTVVTNTMGETQTLVWPVSVAEALTTIATAATVYHNAIRDTLGLDTEADYDDRFHA